MDHCTASIFKDKRTFWYKLDYDLCSKDLPMLNNKLSKVADWW